MDGDKGRTAVRKSIRLCLGAATTLLFCCAVLLFYRGEVSRPAEEAVDQALESAPSVVLEPAKAAVLNNGKRYVGRVEAIGSVNIRPQVAGEIEKVHFTEGSFVRAGDILFTLDARLYESAVMQRRAELAKAKASHIQSVRYYERLKKTGPRAVAKTELEQAESVMLQCAADMENAQALLRIAEIDYEHTKIKAPISGKIGEAGFTKGNYITPQESILANITETNPIRISFSLPDQEYVKQRKKGQDDSRRTADIFLADGSAYRHEARWDFESNKMDAKTGTILTHLKVENGKSILVPGAMVSVAIKQPAVESVVVPNTALMTDENGDYVYVVTSGDIANLRYVTLGERTEILAAVAQGLQKGEKVVVQGVQSVRAGERVNPVSAESGGAD